MSYFMPHTGTLPPLIDRGGPAASPLRGEHARGTRTLPLDPLPSIPSTGDRRFGTSFTKTKATDGIIRCHWLQGTVPHERVHAVTAFLEAMFTNSSRLENAWHANGYAKCVELAPYAVRVLHDQDADTANSLHRGRACLCIPGAALDTLSGQQVHRLFVELSRDFWFMATRVDLAYDDYRRVIAPCDIAGVAECDQFTGYKRWQHVCPRRLGGTLEGDMITFGRRGKDGSGRYLRVYDKSLETGGVENCIRWELELSKLRARAVAFQLGQLPDAVTMAGAMAALVGGSIDFIERRGKNLDRATRLGWWASLVEQMGEVRLASPVNLHSVKTAKQWVQRSVSATLGMLRLAIGPHRFTDWLADVIDDGEHRISPRQTASLKVFWSNGWSTEDF